MFSKSAALAVAGLALSANAHLFISSPSPIEGTAPKDPLDASGSNFPCHGVSLPSSGGTPMAAGSSQLLSFDNGAGANTAVHGGGSCQISITYETDAAKVKDPKSWHVLYSIEGGCPSNTYQNLDGSYTGPQGAYSGALQCTDPKTNGVDCINQFNFTIPKGVKDGHAIMAWTWYNSVGNRELYMNCMNTELSGGDGSEMEEFPSMFVANMAGIRGGNCPTTESQAVQFPFAGKYVTTKLPSGEAAKTASTFPIAKPTGANCANDGAPAAGAGAAPSYGGGAPSASPSKAPKPSGYSGHGGGVLTVTTMHTVTSGAVPSSAAAGSSVAPSAPAGSSGGASYPAAPSDSAAPSGSMTPSSSAAPSYGAAPSGSSSSSGSCSNGKVSCSNPGGVICIGNSQFGLCDVENCALPQALAAGTHCSGGTITKRSHVRHAARHGAHRHNF